MNATVETKSFADETVETKSFADATAENKNFAGMNTSLSPHHQSIMNSTAEVRTFPDEKKTSISGVAETGAMDNCKEMHTLVSYFIFFTV